MKDRVSQQHFQFIRKIHYQPIALINSIIFVTPSGTVQFSLPISPLTEPSGYFEKSCQRQSYFSSFIFLKRRFG